jgi:hypothetical protein
MLTRCQVDQQTNGRVAGGFPRNQYARFVLASVRCRLRSLNRQAWRPVDAVLASRGVSNLIAAIPTLAAALLVIRDGRMYGLINATPALVAIWGVFFGLILAGRRCREVKPPKRKPRRRSELARYVKGRDLPKRLPGALPGAPGRACIRPCLATTAGKKIRRAREPAPGQEPTASDSASRNATSPGRFNEADLRLPDLRRRPQTKPPCMARSGSGVRIPLAPPAGSPSLCSIVKDQAKNLRVLGFIRSRPRFRTRRPSRSLPTDGGGSHVGRRSL